MGELQGAVDGVGARPGGSRFGSFKFYLSYCACLPPCLCLVPARIRLCLFLGRLHAAVYKVVRPTSPVAMPWLRSARACAVHAVPLAYTACCAHAAHVPQLVNFAVVPLHLRIPFVAAVSFGWCGFRERLGLVSLT